MRHGHENGWVRSASTRAAARLLRGRFTGLTISLLCVWTFTTVIADKDLRELLVDVTFSILVLFAIWSVGRRLRIATMVLALPVLVAHWALHLDPSPIPRSVAFALSTGFLAYLTFVVLVGVLQDQVVTVDTIVGAVGAYLLLGVTWGCAYALLALVSPVAFAVSPGLVDAAGWHTPRAPISPLMQYFSFTTLSSVGFGDISPLSGGARTLAALEGLTGQLYIAVLVARLVGMHSGAARAR